jgi:hypothetical protein
MHYVVLKGKDGFQKEEEKAFEYDLPLYNYTVRQYETTNIQPPYYFMGNVRIRDRVFHLKQCLFALGKNIAYYEET